MSTPKRIQMRRTKGWRKPPGAIYIGRPRIWGNPYPVCKTRSAEQAVRAYRMGLRGRWAALAKLEGHDPWAMLSVIAYFQRIRGRIDELRGHDLACWCPPAPGKPCHGDVLLEIANAPAPDAAPAPAPVKKARRAKAGAA